MDEGRIHFLLSDVSPIAHDTWGDAQMWCLMLHVILCHSAHTRTQWCIEADAHQIEPVVLHIFGGVERVLALLKRLVRTFCDQPVVRLRVGGVNNAGFALQINDCLCRSGNKRLRLGDVSRDFPVPISSRDDESVQCSKPGLSLWTSLLEQSAANPYRPISGGSHERQRCISLNEEDKTARLEGKAVITGRWRGKRFTFCKVAVFSSGQAAIGPGSAVSQGRWGIPPDHPPVGSQTFLYRLL